MPTLVRTTTPGLADGERTILERAFATPQEAASADGRPGTVVSEATWEQLTVHVHGHGAGGHVPRTPKQREQLLARFNERLPITLPRPLRRCPRHGGVPGDCPACEDLAETKATEGGRWW